MASERPWVADVSGTSLGDLIHQLESFRFDAAGGDIERVAEMISERQSLIERIRAHDLANLEPEVRTEAVRRIRAVLDRDAKVMEGLRRERDAIEQELSQLQTAKQAARGYGAEARDPENVSFRRTV